MPDVKLLVDNSFLSLPLACMVTEEKCSVIEIGVPTLVIPHLSLAAFKNFSLSLLLKILFMIFFWCGFVWAYPMWDLLFFWIDRSLWFLIFGKFSLFPQVVFKLHSFSFSSGTLMVWMFNLLLLSHKSKALFIFFQSGFCFSERVNFIFLSSTSMILSYFISALLLTPSSTYFKFQLLRFSVL